MVAYFGWQILLMQNHGTFVYICWNGFFISGILSTVHMNWSGYMLAEFAEIFQGIDLHISFILSCSFLILLGRIPQFYNKSN